MKTITQTKKYALGLASLMISLAGVVLFVSNAPVLDVKADLVSYFEVSTSRTMSGSNNNTSIEVGEEVEVFVLLDTNTETITAADLELLYDSTYLELTNGSGSLVTSANVTLWTAPFRSVGAYSTNTVTATGTGSQINVSWGASAEQSYQTSGTSDVYASFYVRGKALTSGTPIWFNFTQGEDNTTDTNATRNDGEVTIDTLAGVYTLTFEVSAATTPSTDVTVQKTASKSLYTYKTDKELKIDYTITISNDSDSSVTAALEDDIIDELDDFFDELDEDDLDDIKTEILETLVVYPSSAVSSTNIDNTLTKLNDGTLDITNITVAAGGEVRVTYTVTLPDDLDLDSFDWDDEIRYGDDIYDENIKTSKNEYDDEDEAIGEPDGEWVSLGKGGDITIELPAGVYVVNGKGEDLRVYEVDDQTVDEDTEDEQYEVYFAKTCSSGFKAAKNKERNSADFDMDKTNLEYAACIKIKDTSKRTSGDAPGADIDAIAILNIGKVLENTVTVTASNDETATDSAEVVVDFTVLFDDLDDLDDDDDDIPPPAPSSLRVSCSPSVMPVDAIANCVATYYDGTLASYVDASLVAVWTSSDSAVATTSGQQVTAISVGTSYITASYNGYTASAQITVTGENIAQSGSPFGLLLAVLSALAVLATYSLTFSKKKC